MKLQLQNNNSENLIIFFCGWGMDKNPFSVLKNTFDILYVYDYTTPDFPNFDFSPYKQINLLAFSYGVYASGIAKLPQDLKITKSIAINGTLMPVNDKYGVPVRQFELTEKMDSKTVVKFRERLFGGEKAKEHFEIFEQNLPQRSAQSCTEELVGMKKYVPALPVPTRKFDTVYLAQHDRCVPTRNQINFWNEIQHSNIINLQTGHFPFYNYNSLEEFFTFQRHSELV